MNERHERFVQAYLKDPNATKAAIEAGYSKKTARSQGQRLLTNVDIAKRIATAREERADRLQIDADFVLQRLVEEATADLADLYGENGALKPISEWPQVWRQGLVSGIDVEQQYSYVDGDQVPDGVVTKVRLSDRIKRLELIGKHVDVQAFSDKVIVGGVVEINIGRPSSKD